jgi:glycosyl transferase family 2
MRPPICLPQAIESIRAQTVADFELFVICDGAPQETVACAQELARLDRRVNVRAFLKGSRVGEAHWHSILGDASGTYVAYLEDDDIWFPNHLDEMGKLLSTVHFGNTLHVTLHPDGRVDALPSDLGIREFRQRFVDDIFNRFGLSTCGHRLDAYRLLPEGWAPTPVGMFPDLHMWRKFLRVNEFEFGTRKEITAITLPGYVRENMSLEERAKESRVWLARALSAEGRAKIAEAAVSDLVDKAVQQEQETLKLGTSYREVEAALAQMEAAYPGSLEKYGHAITVRTNTQLEVERLTVAYNTSQRGLSVLTATSEAELAQLNSDLAELQTKYDRMVRSRYWPLARPLGSAIAAARRLGRSMRPRPK